MGFNKAGILLQPDLIQAESTVQEYKAFTDVNVPKHCFVIRTAGTHRSTSKYEIQKYVKLSVTHILSVELGYVYVTVRLNICYGFTYFCVIF